MVGLKHWTQLTHTHVIERVHLWFRYGLCAKQAPEPLHAPKIHCKLDPKEQTSVKLGPKHICFPPTHYRDVILSTASRITDVSIVYSIVCSGADQRKYQSSASLAFVGEIHRWPVNFPKGPVSWKIFPFDDIIMKICKMAAIPVW